MTENQHWVPKFLIKHFVHEGRVFCLDIHTDKVTKPAPKYAASERGFNDFQVDGKPFSFEGKLQRIETKAAPVLRRIIQAQSLGALSQTDRKHLANFIVAQSFRTKAFYEGMVEKPPRHDFRRMLMDLWYSSFVLVDELIVRPWALMMINTEDVFYLGDNPVVFQRTEHPEDGDNLGFDVEGVEVFLPLSPKYALYLPCRQTSREIIKGYETGSRLHATIRSGVLRGEVGGHLELRTVQAAICRLYPLYNALTTGSPLIALPQIIENFNYLQCSWAHRAVYSNQRDFAFARRVFRENPQYREAPRTSVMQRGTILIPKEDLLSAIVDVTER